MSEQGGNDEKIRWRAYPAWAHFSWLYFFSLMTALRGLLLLRLGLSGSEIWLGGALALLACVVAIRRWGEYFFTSDRVIIRNGYTGRVIQSLDIKDISEILIKQGPIGKFFDVGTLLIRSSNGEQLLTFRGIHAPAVIKSRIDALRP